MYNVNLVGTVFSGSPLPGRHRACRPTHIDPAQGGAVMKKEKKSMKKRILAFVLAAVLACGVLCGCAGASSSSAPAAENPRKSANEIVVGISQDLDDTFDPHNADSAGTREVMFNVYEGLVKPNSAGELICAVAEDYEVSPDRLTYTFTLREGVKFHNGNAVTVNDVIYSLERCSDESEGEALVAALGIIDTVTAADDRTVVVTLEEPSNEFLSYMTAAIVPADYADMGTFPIGTGPYKFVSRTAQDNMVLEKFDEYWGTPAYLDKITFKIIESMDSMVMSLQSGAIDLTAHLSSTQTNQLNEADFTIVEGTMNLVQALYLNNSAAPLNDERVRKALCYAVDKQMVLDMISDGHGAALGSSMYPAFSKYFMDELTDYYTVDVEKAKALLTEAGYPDGFDLTITVPSNYQPHVDTAQVLVEQLKAIGVNASIELVEWASWLSDVYNGRDFEATVCGMDASNMTARAMLERFVSTSHKNFINYNNPEYDALFAAAQACYDDAEQVEIYKQMQTMLTETAANVYVQDLADLIAVRKPLEGLEIYPTYVLDLSTVRYAA